MEDAEIIRMAMFKLRASATKLLRLADQIENPRLVRRMKEIAQSLRAQEAQLGYLLVPDGDHEGTAEPLSGR